MNVRRSISLLALTLSFAAVGCAADASNLPETEGALGSATLKVVTADVSQGKLVAEYVKNGRAITFELRLGPKMEVPPDTAENPEAPTMEVDARILDAEGRTFVMQVAGDKAMDPSWKSPQGTGIDELLRTTDFAAAGEAEAAFRALTVPKELAELRLAAIDIAKGIARGEDTSGKTTAFPGKPTAPGGDTDPTGGLGTKGYVYWSSNSSVNVWDYQIYKKAVVSSFIAEHSAVRLRGWTTSHSLLITSDTCNHGTCASGSAMTSHCNYSGWLTDDGTHSRWFYPETSSSQDTITSGCQTTYGAFFDNGSHVCNDDTLIQRNAITTDSSQSVTGGTCADNDKRWYAPGCQ
ncbi:MAG: hypothetical protein ACXVEF_32390 [Polyangiales bacterium]